MAITFPWYPGRITSFIIPPPRTKHAELKKPPKNLATTNASRLGAAPEAKFVAKNKTLVMLVINRRPYSSERGAQSNGPAAYPVTKIDIHKAATVSDELPKEARTDLRAGANMTDARGLAVRILQQSVFTIIS